MTDITRTPRTAEASTVHEPFGKPSGPGLFHHKGLQLPAYVQHVAHHLVAAGHPESQAIEMAVGIIRDWAAGHDGHGHKVSDVVQAAAAKAMAQWEKDKASGGKASRAVTEVVERGAMSTQDINNLPDSDFAVISAGGSKDAEGKTVPRSLRHLPLHDAAHVRDALSRLPQTALSDAEKATARRKIMAAAKKYGIDSDGDSDSGNASRSGRLDIYRSFPLEDMHIVTRGEGDGSGRVVEAYCAVFNEPTEIRDQQGHYLENIDRTAFNKRIADVRRSKAGFGAVKVFYNHGLTLQGTPSEEFSKPCAVTRDITVDGRGVITRAYYLDTDLGNEVLEMWRSGAITAQSFSGPIIRSSPDLPPGGVYRARGGQLQEVRRLELGLREFGGTPFPYYAGAELVGVRMSPLSNATYGMAEPDEEEEQAPPEEPEAAEEDATEPPAEHSAGHDALVSRMRSLSVTRGVSWKRGNGSGNP